MLSEHQENKWLFSKTVDISVFLGSAIASLLLLAIGWQLGILNEESPDWTWISAVLLIDVAHVWSTSFRVYFDTEELKRRVWLYALVPAAAYAVGVALYSEGELNFWRVLAIVAVFHFVRQQYGWVALYRRKLGETERWTWWIDAVAVYLATVYPLAYWMTIAAAKFQLVHRERFLRVCRRLSKSFSSSGFTLLLLWRRISRNRFIYTKPKASSIPAKTSSSRPPLFAGTSGSSRSIPITLSRSPM